MIHNLTRWLVSLDLFFFFFAFLSFCEKANQSIAFLPTFLIKASFNNLDDIKALHHDDYQSPLLYLLPLSSFQSSSLVCLCSVVKWLNSRILPCIIETLYIGSFNRFHLQCDRVLHIRSINCLCQKCEQTNQILAEI